MKFDVLVIGGGHAGCEAALAAAKLGAKTALVTLDPLKTGAMSCNPCIGGVGKGQLVKEIDALGGEMGKNADATGIQFRRLNTRKGSAVQSSRCQSDKDKYSARMQQVVGAQSGLSVLCGEVVGLKVSEDRIHGVQIRPRPDAEPEDISCAQVIVTSGTFMSAVMHCGDQLTKGGRVGEGAALGISEALSALGFQLIRLKTGTPPRLHRDSLDFGRLQVQKGDDPPRLFSFSSTQIELPQIHCHLTWTSEETHAVIQENLEKSPLFSGKIQGIGPRYCPSIEDKVVKFPDKGQHQVFLEPETLDSPSIYPNGVSTSLPRDVQEKFIRTIPGCEKAEFLRYGYAVEYDCVEPTQLKHTLESKGVRGLYFAGQVNGTSGYEEAAGQGLVAGINAALAAKGEDCFVLGRSESYIGVMIDDLVSKGVSEPYRMFTSRAEFRLSLREDNADQRLRPKARQIGLIGDEEWKRFSRKMEEIDQTKKFLQMFHVKHSEKSTRILEGLGTTAISPSHPETLYTLLKRPEVNWGALGKLCDETWPVLSHEAAESLEIIIKYEGYIAIQELEMERLKKLEGTLIPENLELDSIPGLSHEVKERIIRAKPDTLAGAAQLSGVTPAALSALLAAIRKNHGNGRRIS